MTELGTVPVINNLIVHNGKLSITALMIIARKAATEVTWKRQVYGHITLFYVREEVSR